MGKHQNVLPSVAPLRETPIRTKDRKGRKEAGQSRPRVANAGPIAPNSSPLAPPSHLFRIAKFGFRIFLRQVVRHLFLSGKALAAGRFLRRSFLRPSAGSPGAPGPLMGEHPGVLHSLAPLRETPIRTEDREEEGQSRPGVASAGPLAPPFHLFRISKFRFRIFLRQAVSHFFLSGKALAAGRFL